MADLNLLRRNWPAGGCQPLGLGLALFPEWINFVLGSVSGEMNSFKNSGEIYTNGSVKCGSKLQMLARSWNAGMGHINLVRREIRFLGSKMRFGGKKSLSVTHCGLYDFGR